MADKADGASTSTIYTGVPLAGLCTVAIAPPSGIAVTNDFKGDADLLALTNKSKKGIAQ